MVPGVVLQQSGMLDCTDCCLMAWTFNAIAFILLPEFEKDLSNLFAESEIIFTQCNIRGPRKI